MLSKIKFFVQNLDFVLIRSTVVKNRIDLNNNLRDFDKCSRGHIGKNQFEKNH